MKNILLASYGYRTYPQKGALYDETTYTFNCKSFTSRYFFIALQNLLEVNFDKIILFLTKESRSAYESDIRKYFDNNILEIIDISDGKTIEEIWKLFDGVVEKGDKLEESADVRVYLDITNGFRHLPLVLYNSLSYLESLKKVKIEGIYYGALEAKQDSIIPVFDLTNLAKIIRGSYAVKQLEESGKIGGISDFISDAIAANSKSDLDMSKIKKSFDDFQNLFDAALPLEAGIVAKGLAYNINRFSDSGLKAIDNLIKRISEKLKIVAIDDKSKKEKIGLTIYELKRTLDFIKWEIEIKNISNALLLLREWIISRVMLANGHTDNWIDKRNREKAEYLLGWYSNNHNNFKEHIGYEFIYNWRFLTERRNEYAHGGYRLDRVNVDKGFEKAKEFYELCINNLSNDDFWKLPEKQSGKGSVLITPMGASSGLLFTAVSLVKADCIIVLTSKKFIPKVNEACSKAGLTDMSKVHILTIKDAFCGFNEANELYKQITEYIDNPEEIKINLTGGTTAMQWAMQTAYEKLLKNSINVKRIAFVDRRPSVEQQANPYVLGELLDVEDLIQK